VTVTGGGADGNGDLTCVGWGSPAGICMPEFEWFIYVCNCPGFAGCRYQRFADATCTTCSPYCQGFCDSDCSIFNENGEQYGPIGDDPRPAACTCSNGGATATGGSGGTTGSGGVLGSGGTIGTGGTTGSGSVYGMLCTTNQDCPSDAVCCDGSDPSCDGTKLPAGDGTNSGEFVVSSDGLTVTDTITGLVWQAQESTAITDLPIAQNYCATLALGGVSGWRVPAIEELNTIVDFTVAAPGPTINQTVLSNTPADRHWTSSPYARSPDYAWYVTFSDGNSSFTATEDTCRIRCVRGSRCYPTNRFVVLAGGLVTDALTNLVWKQEASTTDMTWAEAQTYCSSAGSGFRLPTLKELLSIVDFTVASPGPTIDQTAFPNTPPDEYWTSSPYAAPSGYAWFVDFFNSTYGYSDIGDPGAPARVRCVR
jgi:hypothetical protein